MTGSRSPGTPAAPVHPTHRQLPYPAAGLPAARGQSISHSDASPTSSYGYDQAGDTTSRPGQTLSYDPEATWRPSPTGSASQRNVYDADGNLLLRTDPNGNTLYLGDTQAHLANGGTVASASRTYTAPIGNLIAERTTTAGVTGSKLYFLDTDINGTVTATIDTANNPVRRHSDPYGTPRDPAPPAWIDPNSYLDKPANPTTGTVHLGARDYDPTTRPLPHRRPRPRPHQPAAEQRLQLRRQQPGHQQRRQRRLPEGHLRRRRPGRQHVGRLPR